MTKHTRLTTPLVREGGDLREATWDEALERAAAGLAASPAPRRTACSRVRKRRTR